MSDGAARGDALVGRVLDGYRLVERIGEGAMGAVYCAEHPDYPDPVAIKVLHDDLGSIHGLRRRFEREARALAKMDHPGIVSIADYGMVDNVTYIAMELLRGDTLEDLLADHAVQPARGLRIVRGVLDALAYAHDRSVVHRDLKPANIFLVEGSGDERDVKVLDFGFVKFLSVDDLSQDATLTRKGRIVGTPAYMAPEQITGLSLDVRADVYAAGVVLYELLADRRPFVYERRSQLLRAHLSEPIPPQAGVRAGLSVAPELEALVQKALAKDPNARFSSAREMLEALEALPAEPARLDVSLTPAIRERTTPTSSVISAEELAQVASSAGWSEPTPASAFTSSETTPFGEIPESARDTWRPQAARPVEAPPRRRRDPVTVTAWVVALLLVAIAAGLYAFVGL